MDIRLTKKMMKRKTLARKASETTTVEDSKPTHRRRNGSFRRANVDVEVGRVDLGEILEIDGHGAFSEDF